MKKLFLMAVMLMATGVTYAQLEVDANGKVNINEPIYTPAQVNIESGTLVLKGRRYGSTIQNGMNPVLEGQNNALGLHWATVIRGVSYGTDGTTNCGVYGR